MRRAGVARSLDQGPRLLERLQNPDGGWVRAGSSTGSMTVAGIASVSIAQQMLISDEASRPTANALLRRTGRRQVDRARLPLVGTTLAVEQPAGKTWLLYYLYGLERARPALGQRFFDAHDWYREGRPSSPTHRTPPATMGRRRTV